VNEWLNTFRQGVSLREALGVVLVTSVIWLYAEAESVSTTGVETFVRLTVPEGADRVVTTTEPGWSGAISIRVQGARGAIDAAKPALARGIELQLGAEGVPGRPGRHVVDLQDAIQSAALRENTGVVVASVDPPSVTINVEPIVTVPDVPVRTAGLEDLQLANDPILEPQTVTLSAPQSVIEALSADETQLIATVRFNAREVQEIQPGVTRTLTGQMTLADNRQAAPHVSLSPSSATVTIRVQSQIGQVTLPSVPIWELIPPPEADNWTITVDPPFLTDLTISGPNELVQRVETGEIRVIGAVELSSQILEAGGGEMRVFFPGLPDLLQVSGESMTVDVTSTRREQISSAVQP